MKKVVFIDFDDSFSHNLIQELLRIDLEVLIIHWKDFDYLPEADLLVLGPGPGHPSDYQIIFPYVTSWIEQKKNIFGVCLGHQIFWFLRGAEVLRSYHPIHGQSYVYELDEAWSEFLQISDQICVQRYNSLAVKNAKELLSLDDSIYLDGDEILMSRGLHYLTYQFHPESVGTMCRGAFFRPLLQCLV